MLKSYHKLIGFLPRGEDGHFRAAFKGGFTYETTKFTCFIAASLEGRQNNRRVPVGEVRMSDDGGYITIGVDGMEFAGILEWEGVLYYAGDASPVHPKVKDAKDAFKPRNLGVPMPSTTRLVFPPPVQVEEEVESRTVDLLAQFIQKTDSNGDTLEEAGSASGSDQVSANAAAVQHTHESEEVPPVYSQPTDPVRPSTEELDSMTRAQLKETAEAMGFTVKSNDKKADIKAVIISAR